MADEQPSDNPFDQIDPNDSAPAPAAPVAAPVAQDNVPAPAASEAPPAEGNPFDDLGDVGASPSTAHGAFARGAGKGVLPAAGSLAAAGAGAEVGAGLGVLAAPYTAGISVPVGGFVGGIAGGIAGGAAVQKVQDWAVKKLPDTWQDALGADDRQARLDEQQHGTASFIGGIAPYAVTMRPGATPLRELPENATAIQHIMANKATAHLFGGALMGGIELANEKIHGGVDWTKVAISTAFGTVFNKPTGLGETITNAGGRPVRALLGKPEPTLAQAADLKVMGPGVTEAVFHGTQEQAPNAAMTAQEGARAEHEAIGEPPEPDLRAIAQQMEPELFAKYDDLIQRHEALRNWHGEAGDESAAKHMAATEAEIRDISPHVQAAMRRAEETTGPVEEPAEQFPSLAHMLAAHEAGTGRPADVQAIEAPPIEGQPQATEPTGESSVPNGGETRPEINGPPAVENAGVPGPQRTIGEQRAHIAGDVEQKLIAAGRPPEEAAAAGKLIAARYITRAGRFEGKLGTPEELYAREGAAIAGPNGRPQAPAGAPQEPANPAPTAGAAELPKTPQAAKKVLRGRAAADPKTWSLYEFLASNGGLKPTGDLKSIFGGKNPFVPGFGPLLRESGLSLEDALTRAKENSYIFDPNDLAHLGHDATRPPAGELTKSVNDLHDMIDEESRGRKQYRNDRDLPETKVNPDEERASILSALHNELREATGDQQLKVDPALEDRVVEIIQKEGGTDVLSAYERAIMEDHDRYEGLRNDRQAIEHIPGWDAPDIGAAPEHGESHPGERGETGIPGEAAGEGHGAEPRDVGASDRETALAQDVEEYFQRVYHGTEYEQTARGTINIAKGRRPIITLMKDANASTFVHETGHQFLEELMRDAAHPEAPMELRDNAQTVRDWLGVTDDIKTKHHEKFARGFEQYLREGVAPSKELASVFGKFRDWLLSIYQSIKGLGTEISPEIRNVFDRMLEMEPQRTVVAPDRAPGGPTIHDIHEAEATHTPPHEAEAAADRVAAERARHIQEPPPEIAHEIAPVLEKIEAEARAEPGGEAGGGAVGSGEVEPGGGGPGAEPAGGAVGAERGKVGGSGGAASAEGAGAQRIDPRAKLGDSAGTALAPGPADLFGKQSDFVDKSGRILIDKLNTSDDVTKALFDSAAANDSFIGDRRGIVTDGMVQDLANDIGMPGAEALVRDHVIGRAYNAEQVWALRTLLRQAGEDVHTAAAKAAESGLDEDAIAYGRAKMKLKLVHQTFAGARAEAGRAMRAMRRMPGDMDPAELNQLVAEDYGTTLFQLKTEAKLAASMDTTLKMNKFMRDTENRSIGGMVLEVWINGLLSGPATQVSNTISNSVFAVQHFGPEKVGAALVGSIMHAAGREGTYTRLGEVLAAARGAKEGLAPALSATGESFRKGTTGLLPGEEEPASGILSGILHDDMLPRGTLDLATTFGDVQAQAFGAARGVRDAIIAGGAVAKAGGVQGAPAVGLHYDVQGQVPDIQFRGQTVLPIGTAIRSTGRFLATADTFAASLNYSMALNTIAYRMGKDKGLSGMALSDFIADMRLNTPPEIMKEAAGQSRELTFMDKAGAATKALNALTRVEYTLPILGKTQVGKFIAPFTNVVSRILDQTLIKRTPAGLLLSPQIRADLMGKNGNIAQDTAASRMLIGGASLLAYAAYAAEGYITGSGPKDPKENATWRLVNQPHSLKIGGVWYGMQKLGPQGMLMSLAADIHDLVQVAHEKDMSEVIGHLMHAIVQNTLDQSALQGPADTAKMLDDSDRYGAQWVRNFASSFVPNSVNWIAKSRDPYIRQTWTMLDAIKSKVPGYSETLHPKIDIWGQPTPSREQLGGMTGVYMQKVNNDPVNKALLDLNIKIAPPEKKIRNIELTPTEYEDFARIRGRTMKMNLDKVVNSPDFQTWTPYHKTVVINAIRTGCEESAVGMMLGKYHHIGADAVQAKRDKIHKQ